MTTPDSDPSRRRSRIDSSAEVAGIYDEDPGVAGIPVRTGELPVVGEPGPVVRRRPIVITVLAVLGITLLAANLRPAATAIGPVLSEIQQGIDMSGATSGLLTALPGFSFAVFGALAVALSRRAGLAGAVTLGAALIGAGLLTRAFVGTVPLFLVFSVVALAGIAVGNVLVPVAVKRWFPSHAALMTSAYTVFLSVGATLPGLLAMPIVNAMDEGWRFSLGLWGLTAALAFLLWIPLAIYERRRAARAADAEADAHATEAEARAAEAEADAEVAGGSADRPGAVRPDAATSRRPVWRSPRAIALAVFFGIQSSQAYIQFGWIPQMYRDAGLSPENAALLGSMLAAFGMPSGLIMPLIVARVRDVRPWTIGMGVMLTSGYIGLLLAPTTAPVLWVVLLGLSSAAFPTAIALIGARSVAPDVTADLSGFSQSLGYFLAALGPLAVGAAYGALGSWPPIILVLAVSGVVMAVSGSLASRPGAVDDDLRPPESQTA